VFETTAEWECWQHGMIPSGGSAQRALAAPQYEMPSGSEGSYLDQVLRGGIAFGLVVAAAAVVPMGGLAARVPANLSPAAAATAVVTPRRRDEEASDDVLRASPMSVAAIPVPTEAQSAAVAETADITAEDQIATIQESLSLSVTQLAEILDVARGTVYGWMRGEVELPRDHGTAQRLRDLHRIARLWRTRSDETLGRLVAAPLGDDQPSLVALLAANEWDEGGIDRALTILAERLEVRREERRYARDRGLGRARPVTPETLELERLRLRGLS
jgi:DNA-binding transcriptional regulator YiaG